MKPTAVVVDDDPLARERLRDLVEEVPIVVLVGEASDGRSAVELIDRLRPDIAFLDIELPVMSGVEVARRITHSPALVFTTAYGQYAATAFELAAIDYLLKPFGVERFREAVERAIPEEGWDEEGESAVRRTVEMLGSGEPLRRIFVRERGRILPLPVEEISRFEADGDYTTVHIGVDQHLVRLRLQDLEDRLGDRFIRVHRSHLLNMAHVEHFEQHDESRLAAVLRSGVRVVVSRAKSRELRRLAR